MKYVYKIISVTLSLLFLSYINAGVAKSDSKTLQCHFDTFLATCHSCNIAGLKKIVQKKQKYYFYEDNTIRYNSLLFNFQTKFVDAHNKIKWQYSPEGLKTKTLKYTFFKTTKKIFISLSDPRSTYELGGASTGKGQAWGNCEYLPTQAAQLNIKTPNKNITDQIKDANKRPLAKENDFIVCQTATKLIDGVNANGKMDTIRVWDKNKENYVGEANYRGLDCGVKEENKTINELLKKLAALEKQQKVQQQVKTKTIVAKKPKSEFPLKPILINFPSISVKRDDIAVIIGNANYKKMGKDIPNVNPAYADAEGIKQYFMKAKGIKEGNIIYLKDATGAQLLGVFGNDKSYKGKLFNYIKPNKSNVYVYYAGHGAPGEEGDAYLVPTDTDSQTIEFTGYPLSTLYSNLGKLPAKSMTVILEACFSGGSQTGSLISKASPIVITPKKTMIPNNIKVIAAGSERQMASWEEDSSHSLFTKYFLKAMSGEGDSNKDGKVSDAELKEYLSDTMTYYARRYYGRDQKVQIHNGG